ncbi:hypothetical protein C1645_812718 [Glomus cerebriforme]|uniref:Uncharacterized protein n=1 Tax=Glomus cerebriforme TaxID=658196 RepID=A0A397TNH1_9GLOM|nr:hypothetical protein C1645_812718 [Glomus cerebriforme]
MKNYGVTINAIQIILGCHKYNLEYTNSFSLYYKSYDIIDHMTEVAIHYHGDKLLFS